MSPPRTARTRGFTLVEILVVIGIIVILMAILIPSAMVMIIRARNVRIGAELTQLQSGVEKYKEAKGDYPPNSADALVVDRHLRRCYPKMTQAQRTFFFNYIQPQLDPDECVVFWLTLTSDDPRAPFKNFALDSSSNLVFAPPPGSAPGTVGTYPGPYSRNVYYEIDETRLYNDSVDVLPALLAPYCKETTYAYFDSRQYAWYYLPASPIQPWMDGSKVPTGAPPANVRPERCFINPDTYQILCAGQDGNWGKDVFATTLVSGRPQWIANWNQESLPPPAPQTGVKIWPNERYGNGLNLHLEGDDDDNLVNFFNGTVSAAKQ